MENENGNRYGTGEGQGPDYHTGNREPVIVAEQPAREVTDEDSGQASAGQDGSDGWSSPVDAPLQEDRWSESGDKPYLGSPWEPTQSGASYDTGKGNGVSGNDSQPVYKPAPASYGQGQPGTNQSLPGANQGQPGINQGQPGTGRGGDFSQNDSRRERGGGQPGGNSQYQSQYQTQYQTQYQSFQPVYQEKNNMATASLVMGILFPVQYLLLYAVRCRVRRAGHHICHYVKKRRQNGQPGKGRTDTLYYRCCRHCAYYHLFCCD